MWSTVRLLHNVVLKESFFCVKLPYGEYSLPWRVPICQFFSTEINDTLSVLPVSVMFIILDQTSVVDRYRTNILSKNFKLKSRFIQFGAKIRTHLQTIGVETVICYLQRRRTLRWEFTVGVCSTPRTNSVFTSLKVPV